LETANLEKFNDFFFIIGKPIDNNIVYIVNEDLCLLSHGEIGELLIAGKNLANGYIHDNNSKKFIDNPFSSEQGTIEFLYM
jgi:non-ribosomal peptide synthetase component F